MFIRSLFADVYKCKQMSRTVSARIPKETHKELRERCNKIGCSINDFLEASIEFAMTGHSDFDFGDENEKSNKYSEVKQVESNEPEKFQPYYDSHGNYYTYNSDRKMWTCHVGAKNTRIMP